MMIIITHTKKGLDGDILFLCNPATGVRVSREAAIRDIEAVGNRNSPYVVDCYNSRVRIHVVRHNGNRFLRTDPDRTTRDNLAELPDCS